MSEAVLVAIAWPYASAPIHVGNIAGSHLPGDIVARYHRLRGRRVLMVSGSDSHGTPITVKADEENITAEALYKRFHEQFIDLFQQLGISYDIFTTTHTANHFEVAQNFFLALKENGYLYTAREQQWYSNAQNRFLPDRYVEGTCAICGNPDARSDQCEKCGNMLEFDQLLNPRSKIDGSTPELRETEHFYLDLGKLQDEIAGFLKAREHYWRPNVLRQSLGQILKDGLHGRPITRDLDWGIPVPVDGWQNKCLYVWFEAVIGYLSSAIEWSKLSENSDGWHDWWTDETARTLYFIGKDNIPFHAVMWPAELIGIGDAFDRKMGNPAAKPLVLPYDVPANEFMNLEGRKISGSKNWAVWGLDFLERYDADALRYYLTMNMPEGRDSDWDWEGFYNSNNGELVATWGNLVNRVLSFTHKHWDGIIPEPGELRDSDRELLRTISNGFDVVAEKLEKVQLRAAVSEVMSLAAAVNRYLDVNAPWFEIKTDKEQAAKSVFTAIQAIDWLKWMFSPFLPQTCEKLHGFLGYEQPIFAKPTVKLAKDALSDHNVLMNDSAGCLTAAGTDLWQPVALTPGKPFNKPEPLFIKLDAGIIALERSKLGERKA